MSGISPIFTVNNSSTSWSAISEIIRVKTLTARSIPNSFHPKLRINRYLIVMITHGNPYFRNTVFEELNKAGIETEMIL
jgi:hypothetical protein